MIIPMSCRGGYFGIGSLHRIPFDDVQTVELGGRNPLDRGQESQFPKGNLW